MNFFWGYLIGRSLNAGPRRPASPGTALPLYGGALMVGLGLLCLSTSWGGWLALAGLFFTGIGWLMDATFEDDRRHRVQARSPHVYQEPSFFGAVVASLLTLLFFVAILWFGAAASVP